MARDQVESNLKNMGVKGLQGGKHPVRELAYWNREMKLTPTITSLSHSHRREFLRATSGQSACKKDHAGPCWLLPTLLTCCCNSWRVKLLMDDYGQFACKVSVQPCNATNNHDGSYIYHCLLKIKYNVELVWNRVLVLLHTHCNNFCQYIGLCCQQLPPSQNKIIF